MNNTRIPRWVKPAVVAFVLFIIAIIALSSITTVRTDGGHIAVIRNGGPFDNNRIRDIIPPASSLKIEGLNSQTHAYPSNQRYYTITADASAGDRGAVDVFRGSTSDGVMVGVEGSVQFTLNLDPKVLRDFDNRFGTRTYPLNGGNYHAWDGDQGWAAFLDAVFRRQVLDNALRIEIQKYNCVELIPSCKYLNTSGSANQNTLSSKPVRDSKGNIVSGTRANQNLAQIQTDIAKELQADLDSTLRGNYLEIGVFRISRVTLPPVVQEKIDAANAAKVEIQRQQFLADQAVAKAVGERKSNEQLAKGILALNRAYAKSPAKARIDAIKALPPNLQVIGGNALALIGGNGSVSGGR